MIIDVLANDINADSPDVVLSLIDETTQTQSIAFTDINSVAAGAWFSQAWNSAIVVDKFQEILVELLPQINR